MRVIPSTPYQTDSRAEIRIFRKICESFVGDPDYLAFHSLNLTKHKTKRFGEVDFVIVCKYGLFVLEIKGGRVRVEDGIWYTVDRHDNKHKIQDPFRQASTGLHAIKNEIRSAVIFPQWRNIALGYGVVFPDVQWSQQGSEWDLSTICDSKKMRNFESWLKQFFRYWKGKPGNSDRFSADDIKKLRHFLRPDFELVEPLYVKISNLEDRAVKLTEDQYRYLDIVSANKRVLCYGGAGTGKTFLAAELARRMGGAGKNVVVVCKSNWLRRYLETRIVNEFVTISTIGSVEIDMRREGVDKYDVLIVDEGQDLFDFDDIGILDSVIKGGLERGEWYIFHDVNNQHGLFVDTNMEVLELLESYLPAKTPLTTNCRNSEPILKKIQDSLSLDMGNKGTGIGPEVRETVDFENNGGKLKAEIKTMLSRGVSPSSITILSPFDFETSSVSLLPKNMREEIVKLDDYSVRSLPIPKISFSEIKNFKGLENEVIIVIDLPKPENISDADKVEHYVAMSRARDLLSIIWKL